jgi:hypothetical protein
MPEVMEAERHQARALYGPIEGTTEVPGVVAEDRIER